MPDAVDIVLRAGRIYSLSGDDAVFGAIAVTGGQIAATSPERAGLEELVGEETLVVDDDSLTVLPAFAGPACSRRPPRDPGDRPAFLAVDERGRVPRPAGATPARRRGSQSARGSRRGR
ncbi:MAG TPA: hypothetical protein VIH37_13645, partial [Candidatus Limnocylindrales bacterium]